MRVNARAFTHSEAGTRESAWSRRREWAQVIPAEAIETTGARRLVVVAAHPDDETLAAGGLTALAARAGLDVHVVLLTDGEGSHPHSPTVARDDLARRRVEESTAALRLLAPQGTLHRLGLPDGALADHADDVVTALVDLIGEEGHGTVLVAPWRDDGHADHDAAGAAAGVAAWRTDATLWEYPVWLWHWCDPDQAPWRNFHVVTLPPEIQEAKRVAVARHRTQVSRLSDAPGDDAVLQDGMLDHFRRPYEVFLLLKPPADDSLDRLHDTSPDPWSVRTSWYEERKRAITVASLPHRRHRRALEVGGSVGALARDLAARCDELVVVDESGAATTSARATLEGVDGVTALQLRVPEQWPAGGFDLVVVSEVGYFLSPQRLRRLVARVEECLSDEGVVVLCHWRHPVRGWPLDGGRVHQIWREQSDLPVVATHVETDFRLDALSRTSVHRAESP